MSFSGQPATYDFYFKWITNQKRPDISNLHQAVLPPGEHDGRPVYTPHLLMVKNRRRSIHAESTKECHQNLYHSFLGPFPTPPRISESVHNFLNSRIQTDKRKTNGSSAEAIRLFCTPTVRPCAHVEPINFCSSVLNMRRPMLHIRAEWQNILSVVVTFRSRKWKKNFFYTMHFSSVLNVVLLITKHTHLFFLTTRYFINSDYST